MNNEEIIESINIQEPLKVAVLREELVKLTGNSNNAIVLNQFIYWSERTKTAANFVREEMERVRKFTEEKNTSVLSDLAADLKQGWIYKSAVDLIEDTMLTISKATMARIIKELVDNNWIMKRKNPRYRGDNTPQYRVNLFKIQTDLYSIGYSLNGYKLVMQFVDFAKIKNLESAIPAKEEVKNDVEPNDTKSSQNETGLSHGDITSSQNETGLSQNDSGSSQNDFTSSQNETTLPETTSQTTPEFTNIDHSNTFIEEEEELPENKLKDTPTPHGSSEDSALAAMDQLAVLTTGNKQLRSTMKYLYRQGVDLSDIVPIIVFLKENPDYMRSDLISQQAERNSKVASTTGLFSYSDYFINGIVRFAKNIDISSSYENEKQFDLDVNGDLPRVSLVNWLKVD